VVDPTNEREGSDIAAELIRALNDAGIRIVVVTHMYDLAHRYEEEHAATTLSLRADRGEEGHPTFQLHEAPPLPTSFGEDLYRRPFYPEQDPKHDDDRYPNRVDDQRLNQPPRDARPPMP